MRVAHILRKYNPDEWGGTETALLRLLDGLRPRGVTSMVYAPRTGKTPEKDPLARAGYAVKHFNACVPVWGIPEEHRRQMIAVGGNLMSFDLIKTLALEPGLSLVHTHALGRLGGIAHSIARRRGLPCVVSIHGGVLDLPPALKQSMDQNAARGLEWGKIFGLLFKSRQLLAEADAVITVNPREAALLREKYPHQRIQIQPHGVPTADYERESRAEALAAYPQLRNKQVLLSVGRIDSVKNQGYLVERAPALFMKHPEAMIVLAGACTDEAYGAALNKRVQQLGLESRIILTGGLPPGDPRLLGLFQMASAVLLPSLSETFGLVLLEAWAAGTTVISSRTSGASALIEHRKNGWLFDLENPHGFHEAVDEALLDADLRHSTIQAGKHLARTQYDTHVLAGGIKNLYQELIEERHALRRAA
jgi:glycosyltransferase involved in cell wall biosynthesis